jgi:hypothetical protein
VIDTRLSVYDSVVCVSADETVGQQGCRDGSVTVCACPIPFLDSTSRTSIFVKFTFGTVDLLVFCVASIHVLFCIACFLFSFWI